LFPAGLRISINEDADSRKTVELFRYYRPTNIGSKKHMIDRRHFLGYFSALGLSGTLLPGALYAHIADGGEVTAEAIRHAELIAGVRLNDEQREAMVDDLNRRTGDYEAIRQLGIPNEVPPAVLFEPDPWGTERGSGIGEGVRLPEDQVPSRPEDPDDLAFLSVSDLSRLMTSRQISSVELTEHFLGRLKDHGERLLAVVTLTEERAMAAARRADAELAAGRRRSPLHGIPYGAKDLLATRGYATTWGTEPYREQTFDYDAAVVERLEEAGAVLVAKLTLGELAWGDVWFGGMTRNPWNLDQGASGSSAGSGSAVAAGLVPFAIGTETLGSIVSPSTRNGVTGHRPTFGAVSRHGAMALSWSLDKIGPMARSVMDCAIVFDAIRGADGRDPSARDFPFSFDPTSSLGDLRVGFFERAFEQDYPGRTADLAVLDVLRGAGVQVVSVDLPSEMPLSAMLLMLEVEAASAFDELTRTGGLDRMRRQGRNTWPHVFRTARMYPAVEYVQAARARSMLMDAMRQRMRNIDVLVSPSFVGGALQITNLTGHPTVVVPNAFDPVPDGPVERRSPGSISFVGALYGDASALRLAHAYQQVTDFHTRRPSLV
jgi:Asp-tRNA(Asn)/Glu-tRNA(Gln) amidotransferase A subunit family amidase